MNLEGTERIDNLCRRLRRANLIAFILTFAIIAAVFTGSLLYKKTEHKIKSVKINYATEQEIQDIIGFEEYEDGKWFKGNLKYDHSEDLDYGMKCANYTGVLYETK
ncbi:hypothetical protein [Butyrivibrio sp. M55]|uniref:hypothetical protein n=1 Tax=Butyrivibrio sp. M55 TaxID=1855323 RepID=UPI0008F2F4A9|nr:hypothetical protein [Butyrivibrio sp. M55]SFU52741.1 hypothetical protein SAMN05216540_103154 [Butyrivibrio sp. M55]